jgi:DeoR family transcriptional regulator, aga operon transcriptional repressor
MSAHERWNALLEMLARDGSLDVTGAARELRVSAATIRRDLDQLAQQQMLTRTRGGASANSVSYDLPLRYKSARRAGEKELIAKAAAALIPPGSVVALNGGTTTTEVARALATRVDPDAGSEPTLTVVTNALNIANELIVRRHIKIVVTGGVARPQSYELIGPLATRLLGELSLDQVCLGVDALSARDGATAYNEGEASINQLMVARAREVIVVADSSKLGKHAFARVCPIDRVDVLVTDSAADPAVTRSLEDAGVRVVTT